MVPMIPHEFQSNYLAKVSEGWKLYKKQLVVSPTGSGKTCMFSWMSGAEVKSGGSVLILVDQDELVWQTKDKIQEVCGISAEVEKAENFANTDCDMFAGSPIVIASVQTLMRENRRNRWQKNRFTLVIADEADKSIAPSWQSVLNHFDEHARVCGFTATPNRTDQRNLGEYYENSIELENLFSLIKKGFLSPLSLQFMPIRLDTSGKGEGKDFTKEEADDIITPHLAEIAKSIMDKALFRRTLVFLPLIKTCEKFNDIANDLGLMCDYVYGVDDERDEKLKSFKNGEFFVLANSMLLTRGIDIPQVDCIVLARPTKSVTLLAQMIGRGTRLFKDKENCLLLDFLLQVNGKKLCRPAHLIAKSEEEAEEIMALAEAQAAGLPEGVVEQLDLLDVAADASSEREEKLREKLEALRDKKAKFISAQDFAMQHNSIDAAEFEPTMKWHSHPISEKQAKYIVKAGIDLESVSGKGQASALLDIYFKNKPLVSATYAQRKKMAAMGYPNAWQATSREASQFFATLK